MGMTKPEIVALIPQIEEFTDLGNYLTLPIRTYSAGMMLRLAFGIATALQPDIILLDEIISAGDQAFADKAAARLEKLISHASILVLASHDAKVVKSMCSSAIWLEHGRVIDHGPAEDIIERYVASIATA